MNVRQRQQQQMRLVRARYHQIEGRSKSEEIESCKQDPMNSNRRIWRYLRLWEEIETQRRKKNPTQMLSESSLQISLDSFSLRFRRRKCNLGLSFLEYQKPNQQSPLKTRDSLRTYSCQNIPRLLTTSFWFFKKVGIKYIGSVMIDGQYCRLR